MPLAEIVLINPYLDNGLSLEDFPCVLGFRLQGFVSLSHRPHAMRRKQGVFASCRSPLCQIVPSCTEKWVGRVLTAHVRTMYPLALCRLLFFLPAKVLRDATNCLYCARATVSSPLSRETKCKAAVCACVGRAQRSTSFPSNIRVLTINYLTHSLQRCYHNKSLVVATALLVFSH